jgi:myo-inositol-1(or 4)-monophosphatase
MLNTATAAALKAGKYIHQQTERLDQLTIESKELNDFVSDVDRTVEADIIGALQRAYPDHGFLGEESEEIINPGADYQWIIDPLDGTTNFLRGVPHFAVSIALTYKGRLEQAVIYDPIRDELFTASRGDGARLNNKRIRVGSRRSLSGALLSTGIPYRESHMKYLDTYLDTVKALLPGTAGVRRQGAASLDLAYVAAGRYDGFWEFDLKPWDIAAGLLIIQEAGGLSSDMQGGSTQMETGNVVAGSPKVFKEMLQRLNGVTITVDTEESTDVKAKLSLKGKSEK